MLAPDRYSRIRDALRTHRTVGTVDLADDLGVSVETVRRDLVELERQGVLVRVHGGATRPTTHVATEAPFTERSTSALEAKRTIGALAAKLIRPGQLVAIDVGTTAIEVAKAVPRDLRATVVTCSLLVAAEFARCPDVDILVSGGRLRRGDLALSGSLAERFVADLYPDIAFVGSGGIDAEAGLTDFHLDEIPVKRSLLARAGTAYVLADSSKWGVVGPYAVADLRRIDGLITNDCPPPALRAALDDADVTVVAPQDNPTDSVDRDS